MKTSDFVIQTILLSLALFCTIAGFIIAEWFFLWLAVVQFFMGVWQLISAIVSLFLKNQRNLFLFVYWGLIVVYFGMYVVIQYVYNSYLYDYSSIMNDNYLEDISTRIYYLLAWFFMAWIIAIYYYTVVTIRLFKKPIKQTFLDIAN